MDSYHNKSFLINILKNCTAEVFRWSKSYCQVVLTFSDSHVQCSFRSQINYYVRMLLEADLYFIIDLS